MAASEVQNAKGTATSGTVVITFGSNVTAGNNVIVAVGTHQSTTNPTVSGVTLGTTALTKAVALNTSSDADCEYWYLENAPSGQNTVTISFNAGSGTSPEMVGIASEWTGLASSGSLDAAPAGGSGGPGTSWSSGSSGTLSQPAEVVFGAVMISGSGGTITPPGSPWTNETQTAGVTELALGYQVVSATTALTYSGTTTTTSRYASVIVSFRQAAAVTPAPFTPPSRGRGRPGTARGSGKGSAGAPYTAPPPAVVSLFTPRRKPAKGAQAAARGRAESSAGAPYVFVPPAPPSPFTPRRKPARGAQAARRGTGKGSPGAPVLVQVVNQWKASFSQPAAFQNMPPGLQSVTVPLNLSSSVMAGGSGTPSRGNWLFCITGITESSAAAGFTVAASDDQHGFWRPGDVSSSTWSVSAASALARTSVWYTPNLVRVPSTVYVAPNGCCDACTVLVVEVAGLGPWDQVSGIYSNYAAAATSLNLALSAPPAPAFLLAAAAGDLTTAGQAFAPAGWTPLTTVTAANGTDHTCDSVLTAACIATSSAVSVNATASSATDLSGVIIGVLQNAPSPVPAGANPGWAGRFIAEIGLGAGFQTPPDQITWTKVIDNTWATVGTPGGTFKRVWTWNDSGGIQYNLGGLQSGEGTTQWDNADGYLTPGNTASPLYPDIQPGTPVRIRAALGTIAGVVVDSWYVIQKNALKFTERRTQGLRSFVEAGLTDIYSVMSAPCPSPYRGEVYQDQPYAWWPCDDQPVSGGVLPAQLRNAAEGTGLPLQIVASPNGISGQDGYSSSGAWTSIGGSNPGADGTDLTALLNVVGTSVPPPSVATYSVAADSGWMYGDPQSSPGVQAGGGPVTAQPGAAAWQQSGASGNTGASGWFLACNDPSFPPLSSGITVESWFNWAYFRTATGVNDGGTYYGETGQPYCPLTLWELATATGPVCLLQLDLSGHLQFITYNGSTPTTTTIYNSSDLRCNAWVAYAVKMNQSSWTVYVNAGLTAKVSGSGAGMTSSWSWFFGNGDLGTSGGSNLAAIQHGGNCEASHIKIYPSELPDYRILAHYNAALTGFGVLPAPTSPQIAATVNISATGFTADGSEYKGQYGFQSGAHPATTYTMSMVAAAIAGSYHSGPSSRAISAGFGNPGGYANALYTSWTAVAPLVNVYTAASADAETQAAAVLGTGDTFTAGFGSGATGTGPAQVSAGTGASPPAGPSALGDGAGERIERILGYGTVTYPGRAIDPDSGMVQAALDICGQSAGQNTDNIRQSVTGLLSVDSLGNLCFRDRARLAADTPVWALGPDVSAGQIPYDASQTFSNDPQRVWNLIRITPYAPDGATLATITPSSFSAALASQEQYGARPLPFTSYLQSTSEMQAQADWLLTEYGTMHRRVEGLKIDAAQHPSAWPAILGMQVGDLATVTDMPFGPPVTTGTYRISSIRRAISFGANGSGTEASLTVALDFEPSSYWS